MNVALYADYAAELRALFSELNDDPEEFQTFSVHMELAAAGGLIVYETQRRKGQTDSLYYARTADAAANRQISQARAFAAIDRFLALGEFVALTGEGATAPTVDARFPHCAVNFSYRRKGHPAARSMLMVFIGFNDEADALGYVAAAGETPAFVAKRPFAGEKAYEWR